jgi:uncharacterized membrane protein YcfT
MTQKTYLKIAIEKGICVMLKKKKKTNTGLSRHKYSNFVPVLMKCGSELYTYSRLPKYIITLFALKIQTKLSQWFDSQSA